MRYVVAALLIVVAIPATDAFGQVYYGGYRPYGYGRWGGGYPAFYGGTVAGSAAAGMGAMIQAQGAYNQMTAQAATQYEQAKSLALDNKLKSAQTYYQLQRLNQENRAEQERQKMAARVDYTPPPKPQLTSQQLDPVTGAIAWPATLTAADYMPERSKLDDLFAQRAKNPASVSPSQVSAVVLAMRNKLDAKFDSVPQGDFFESRHFLDMLAGAATASPLADAQASVPQS